MLEAIFMIIGLTIGLCVGLAFAHFRVKDAKQTAEIMLRDMEQRKKEESEAMMAQMKDSFDALSLKALSTNMEQFLKTANETFGKHSESSAKEMDSKKELIDQTLKTMKGELGKVSTLMGDLEKDRKAKFEVLASELSKTANETRQLRETTHTLQSALTNSRVRGQWGERMAEDVLRLAGFIEGTNYLKQGQTEGKGRPDFTFYLPDDHIVHMDVKFPLENYLNFIEAETEADQVKYRDQFMKDTRLRIDEVTKRDYVDTTQGTLDYVLVFIPNEQVYAFINEQDRDLLDKAMRKKIILCSPTTLYAVLAVIRQAVDNFHMERKAGEILDLLGKFSQQWDKFAEAMDKVGKKIDDSQKAFLELSTTRRRALERPLSKIGELKDNERVIETETGAPLKVIDTEAISK